MKYKLGITIMIIFIGIFVYTRPVNIDSLILQSADNIEVYIVEYENIRFHDLRHLSKISKSTFEDKKTLA